MRYFMLKREWTRDITREWRLSHLFCLGWLQGSCPLLVSDCMTWPLQVLLEKPRRKKKYKNDLRFDYLQMLSPGSIRQTHLSIGYDGTGNKSMRANILMQIEFRGDSPETWYRSPLQRFLHSWGVPQVHEQDPKMHTEELTFDKCVIFWIPSFLCAPYWAFLL